MVIVKYGWFVILWERLLAVNRHRHARHRLGTEILRFDPVAFQNLLQCLSFQATFSG